MVHYTPAAAVASTRRRRLPALVVTTVFAGALVAISPVLVLAMAGNTKAVRSMCPGANIGLLGPDVCVFTPEMSEATVQADLDALARQQVPNQFGPQRYAVFFEPGTYGTPAQPLVFQVGYYTEVAGLGKTPRSTVINGAADVFNQCFGPPNSNGGGRNCNGLDNFWRSLYNLTLDPPAASATPSFSPAVPDTLDYSTVNGVNVFDPSCNEGKEFWATSQAAPMRRVVINGFLTLEDYCGDQNYASGGFIADSELNGGTLNGSQQQFLVRNSTIASSWANGVWNQVFMGDNGNAVPAQSFGALSAENKGPEPYTTLPRTPVSEEEPFLYRRSNGHYDVALSALELGATGPSWAAGGDLAASVPLSKFFIAFPRTPEAHINAALSRGQDLMFTPGQYHLASPIVVSRPGTIVMGLGFATLVPERGNAAMTVMPNVGVRLSGLIFDAGPANSPVLLTVGTAQPGPGAADDPDLVQDTFFRVGGEAVGSATVSFVDNADYSIIDNVWAWRADHAITRDGTGWMVNRGSTGLIVNGSYVNAYGLFVEHYQKYEVIWRGQGGTEVFFQNEMPYDPPNQSAWMENPTTDGFPAFLVASNVTSFQAYGVGSYCFFYDADSPGEAGPPVQVAHAFESPDRPGVQWVDLLTVSLDGTGVIQNIINSTGGPTVGGSPTDPMTLPVNLVSYP
jgi:hypothetical protein